MSIPRSRLGQGGDVLLPGRLPGMCSRTGADPEQRAAESGGTPATPPGPHRRGGPWPGTAPQPGNPAAGKPLPGVLYLDTATTPAQAGHHLISAPRATVAHHVWCKPRLPRVATQQVRRRRRPGRAGHREHVAHHRPLSASRGNTRQSFTSTLGSRRWTPAFALPPVTVRTVHEWPL